MDIIVVVVLIIALGGMLILFKQPSDVGRAGEGIAPRAPEGPSRYYGGPVGPQPSYPVGPTVTQPYAPVAPVGPAGPSVPAPVDAPTAPEVTPPTPTPSTTPTTTPSTTPSTDTTPTTTEDDFDYEKMEEILNKPLGELFDNCLKDSGLMPFGLGGGLGSDAAGWLSGVKFEGDLAGESPVKSGTMTYDFGGGYGIGCGLSYDTASKSFSRGLGASIHITIPIG